MVRGCHPTMGERQPTVRLSSAEGDGRGDANGNPPFAIQPQRMGHPRMGWSCEGWATHGWGGAVKDGPPRDSGVSAKDGPATFTKEITEGCGGRDSVSRISRRASQRSNFSYKILWRPGLCRFRGIVWSSGGLGTIPHGSVSKLGRTILRGCPCLKIH